MSTTMKEYRLPAYAQCHGPESLLMIEAAIPKAAVNEVIVRVHAVSLNYRDITTASGRHSLAVKDNVVPCSDAAGVVVEVGLGVRKWTRGDRVMPSFTPDWTHGPLNANLKASSFGGPTDGVLREYISVPAHSLVRIPDHLSFEEASCLPCAALSAWNALFGSMPGLRGGETVVIQGTGGVSTFALQLAAAAGANTIVTSSSDEKLALAAKLGAKHLVNYRKNPNWDEAVLKLTDDLGADRIVEVGGAGTMEKSCRCIAYGGMISTVGFVAAGHKESTFQLGLAVLSRSIILRGILCGSVTQFEDLCRFIAVNQITPVIDKVFSFDQAREAYEHLASQEHVGKVVIRVSD